MSLKDVMSMRRNKLMRGDLPKSGEVLALREDRARPLFDKWLRDENLSGKIAALSFAQHSAMAQQVGWLQARWHEDGELTVSQVLSFDSVWEVNPFEVGARRPMTRKMIYHNDFGWKLS